jgi:hypothetical protein
VLNAENPAYAEFSKEFGDDVIRKWMTKVGLERVDDVRENVTDGGTEQCQDDDDDDGDQDENQRVLNETLTLFTRHIQHFEHSLLFMLPTIRIA